MSNASRRRAQELANMSMDELNALEAQENAVQNRADSFAYGSAGAILNHWVETPPTYEELLTIVHNMLVREANKS